LNNHNHNHTHTLAIIKFNFFPSISNSVRQFAPKTQRTQQNEILNALDPVNWPTTSTEPINEFDVISGLASLAFMKLFPLGKAVLTKKGSV
jgi:hypothetical protein